MKWWYFVILTVLCWGAYVPMIHHGQMAMGKNSGLRAFLFVGLAYCVVAVAAPLALLWATRSEPWQFTGSGMRISFLAGVLGAIGALGIIFALKPKYGGLPIFVAPLVFAGAPIMNTFVSMIWDRPAHKPAIWYYMGIGLAAVGAAITLYFKPK